MHSPRHTGAVTEQNGARQVLPYRQPAPAGAPPAVSPHVQLLRETSMAKAFASQADLEEKKVTWTRLSENAYAYTTEGDPNSGVIVGDDGVLIVDTPATPAMAQDLIAKIRSVTDKPIKYVVLSHYHAVRVLGASAYFPEGAQQIIAS